MINVIESETDVAWEEEGSVADFLDGLTFIEEAIKSDEYAYNGIIRCIKSCNRGIEAWLNDREFVSGYREIQLDYFYNIRVKYLNDLKVYKVGRVTPTKPWPRR